MFWRCQPLPEHFHNPHAIKLQQGVGMQPEPRKDF
jgi:hypothetical protein